MHNLCAGGAGPIGDPSPGAHAPPPLRYPSGFYVGGAPHYIGGAEPVDDAGPETLGRGGRRKGRGNLLAQLTAAERGGAWPAGLERATGPEEAEDGGGCAGGPAPKPKRRAAAGRGRGRGGGGGRGKGGGGGRGKKEGVEDPAMAAALGGPMLLHMGGGAGAGPVTYSGGNVNDFTSTDLGLLGLQQLYASSVFGGGFGFASAAGPGTRAAGGGGYGHPVNPGSGALVRGVQAQIPAPAGDGVVPSGPGPYNISAARAGPGQFIPAAAAAAAPFVANSWVPFRPQPRRANSGAAGPEESRALSRSLLQAAGIAVTPREEDEVSTPRFRHAMGNPFHEAPNGALMSGGGEREGPTRMTLMEDTGNPEPTPWGYAEFDVAALMVGQLSQPVTRRPSPDREPDPLHFALGGESDPERPGGQGPAASGLRHVASLNLLQASNDIAQMQMLNAIHAHSALLAAEANLTPGASGGPGPLMMGQLQSDGGGGGGGGADGTPGGSISAAAATGSGPALLPFLTPTGPEGPSALPASLGPTGMAAAPAGTAFFGSSTHPRATVGDRETPPLPLYYRYGIDPNLWSPAAAPAGSGGAGERGRGPGGATAGDRDVYGRQAQRERSASRSAENGHEGVGDPAGPPPANAARPARLSSRGQAPSAPWSTDPGSGHVHGHVTVHGPRDRDFTPPPSGFASPPFSLNPLLGYFPQQPGPSADLQEGPGGGAREAQAAAALHEETQQLIMAQTAAMVFDALAKQQQQQHEAQQHEAQQQQAQQQQER